MTCPKLLVPVFLLLSLHASSQMRGLGSGNLKVRVVYTNDRALEIRVRVQLMSAASNEPIAEVFTDDHGEAEFSRIGIGSYHVIVSGEGIQEADSGAFAVDPRKDTQSVLITVRRTGEGEQSLQLSGSTVSATELNIPPEAKVWFDDATSLMTKQSWKEAVEKLQRAVEIYPKYVDAYANLGVVYARLGEWDQEREALNKALSFNDRFAPALLNLGMLEIRQKHYAEAERVLTRASAANPTNVQTLALLAQSQLLDTHYEAAIATTRKAHTMPHNRYAIVHYIAARAFLHEELTPNAIAEFKLMLKEEPSGDRADAVRKELANLESQAH